MPTTTTTANVPNIRDLSGRLIDSRLGIVHRTSRAPLRRALSAIPEWAATVDRLNRLEVLRPPPPAADDAAVYELAVWFEEATRADDPPGTDEAVKVALRVHEHTTTQALLVRAFRQTASALAVELDQAVRDNAEHVHQHLTAELRAVVDRGREVAGGFDLDAESAIAAGRVEEYQAAAQIAREYRVFRAIRNELDAALGWPTGPDVPVMYPELRWIANPVEVFEHWRAWVVDGYLVDPRNPQHRVPLSPPWPRFGLGPTPEEEAAAWLRFLVNCPTAVPWLPSPDDFLAATQGLLEYARPPEQRTSDTDARKVPA